MKTCFECNFIYIYHSLSVEPETKKKDKRSASESVGSAGSTRKNIAKDIAIKPLILDSPTMGTRSKICNPVSPTMSTRSKRRLNL